MWTVGTVKRFENALFDFQERGSVGPRKLYSRHFNLVLIRDFHPGSRSGLIQGILTWC